MPSVKQPKLLEVCSGVATRISGKKSQAGPIRSLNMPPRIGDGTGNNATRRKKSLETIDEIQRRLKTDPRHPKLHYLLGVVYLYSMSNPTLAESHLCRAVLEAPTERSYALTVRAAWMRVGMEKRLFDSLPSGASALPWKANLEYVRTQEGDEESRAALFEGILEALGTLHRLRRLPRMRRQAVIQGFDGIVTGWARGAEQVQIVVSFPKRFRKRIQDLPDGVRSGVGNGSRGVVFANGVTGIERLLALVRARLSRVSVVIAIQRDGQGVLLIGAMKKAGFNLRHRAVSEGAKDMFPSHVQ